MGKSLTEIEVWERVRRYAEECMERGVVVMTLRDAVPNVITRVTDGEIHRRSERGMTNATHIRRSHVFHVWRELNGQVGGDYPAFTKALVLGALPDQVVQRDSGLALREPAVARDDSGRGD